MDMTNADVVKLYVYGKSGLGEWMKFSITQGIMQC